MGGMSRKNGAHLACVSEPCPLWRLECLRVCIVGANGYICVVSGENVVCRIFYEYSLLIPMASCCPFFCGLHEK
jgi:hypothetical protein